MVLQPPIWADLRPGVDPLLGGPQLLAPGPCFSRPISPGMPPRITPVGPLWTPVSGPMPPVQLPWPGPGSGSGEPQLQILPPMPRVGKESLALGTFHPSTLSPRKFNLPEDLLSRIEGVVTNMEKNVAEEQRLRISEAVCSSCGAALTGDARFCDRCGRQQVDHAPEDDLVQNLAQRLESLESRRQVAEQRATQLEELRRLVAEGRHKQYLTHFITLDDHGFDLQKRENGSAASTQSTGSREVKSAEDSQLHAALAQVEDAFTEELNVLGVAGAESRLHERLERLLKAVLHRESVAEARLKEQRELTHAAERELQVLEETSQKVLEDCRLLQAGLGYGTFLILLITGMIWCADAAEISLIMYVIKDVQKALRLSDASVVLLEQASFAGQLLGPMFWGRFADTRGRRPAILLCSGFVLGFGIITACAQTFWQLVIARAGVGFGISVMFICVDIACELLPKERALSIALNFFHPFGSMFTMFCAFLFLENSGWRMLTSCAVLPTFFALGLALAYLPESPRWLLENGRHFEALQSIRHIADLNGVKTSFTGLLPELPESELIPDASPKDAWFVWGQHRWTLLNQMCVWFSLGMAGGPPYW
ncbi:unnamed protein product [Durusdinium trenchii]|uniref:Major facilitator superfamily (MFS) profile domain-containing protein n=1 Tax=Durusdinium trenchii TaxID=1381693 RepID=A0ABP0HFM1_9DINO